MAFSTSQGIRMAARPCSTEYLDMVIRKEGQAAAGRQTESVRWMARSHSFPAHWHFQTGLVNEQLVYDMFHKGRRMLSVGTGTGTLEAFMADRLGIAIPQITVSDIRERILPEGFWGKIFDMHGSWPDFERRFDYVIFPESVFVGLSFNGHNVKDGLVALMEKSLAVLNEGGQVRMASCYPSELELIQVVAEMRRTHSPFELAKVNGLIVARNGEAPS